MKMINYSLPTIVIIIYFNTRKVSCCGCYWRF